MELKNFLKSTLKAITDGCEKNAKIEIEFEMELTHSNNEICILGHQHYPKIKFKVLVDDNEPVSSLKITMLEPANKCSQGQGGTQERSDE